MKSRFIHTTKGGWEQVPTLEHKLLPSQETLLQWQKELLQALTDTQKEDDLVKAQGALATVNGKIYVAQDETERAKVEVKKAREEAAQAKEEAAKAKECKKEVDRDVLLLIELIRTLKADLAAAKIGYAEVNMLVMEYAGAKGVA